MPVCSIFCSLYSGRSKVLLMGNERIFMCCWCERTAKIVSIKGSTVAQVTLWDRGGSSLHSVCFVVSPSFSSFTYQSLIKSKFTPCSYYKTQNYTNIFHLISLLPNKKQFSLCILSPTPLLPCVSHRCLFILNQVLLMCVSVCMERAAGASAVVSSDSSTAYGRALWRMGAVTRQSAYLPMGEANRANTMRKRRKQLNISTPLIYSPTLGEVYWRSLEERAFTLAMAKVTKQYYTVNRIKNSYSAGVKVSKAKKEKEQTTNWTIFQVTHASAELHIWTHYCFRTHTKVHEILCKVACIVL